MVRLMLVWVGYIEHGSEVIEQRPCSVVARHPIHWIRELMINLTDKYTCNLVG